MTQPNGPDAFHSWKRAGTATIDENAMACAEMNSWMEGVINQRGRDTLLAINQHGAGEDRMNVLAKAGDEFKSSSRYPPALVHSHRIDEQLRIQKGLKIGIHRLKDKPRGHDSASKQIRVYNSRWMHKLNIEWKTLTFDWTSEAWNLSFWEAKELRSTFFITEWIKLQVVHQVRYENRIVVLRIELVSSIRL